MPRVPSPKLLWPWEARALLREHFPEFAEEDVEKAVWSQYCLNAKGEAAWAQFQLDEPDAFIFAERCPEGECRNPVGACTPKICDMLRSPPMIVAERFRRYFGISGRAQNDAAARRPVSPIRLQSWYCQYVEEQKTANKMPSRDQDWAAAKLAFGGHHVPRKSVRDLRHQFAPNYWKDQGRRKLSSGR